MINDDEQYLSENNFYAENGSFVHEILARVFNKEISLSDAVNIYMNEFDDNVLYPVRESIKEKTFEACANYFSTTELEWVNGYDVIGVEKEIHFKCGEYNFIGFIDLLLQDKVTGDIVIADHKSTEYLFKKDGTVKKKEQKNYESYRKQMYLYAHAVKQIYGKYPVKLMWNHFKDNGAISEIEFSEENCKIAVNWAIDTIHKIEKEEEFLPTEDFFYCYNLCNFRNSCEYKNMKVEENDET